MNEKRNPYGETVNIPIGVTGFDIGPHHEIGTELSIQPLVPIPLTDDWDVIARPFVPLTYSPFPEKRFGLGDIQPSFFLTPKRVEKWIWGVGPAFELPTATSKVLGTGKWSGGPTGALIYSENAWFAGVLISHLWSFAGAHRARVNQSAAEVNVQYSFESGVFLQFDPTVAYDWTAPSRDAWTLPLGLDVGKTVQIGAQSITFQVGAYNFVKRPTDTTQWLLRGQISFAFPR